MLPHLAQNLCMQHILVLLNYIVLFLTCSQSDIVGINDIFRDLATLVNDQGEVIGEL